jgi:hypothetical protein
MTSRDQVYRQAPAAEERPALKSLVLSIIMEEEGVRNRAYLTSWALVSRSFAACTSGRLRKCEKIEHTRQLGSRLPQLCCLHCGRLRLLGPRSYSVPRLCRRCGRRGFSMSVRSANVASKEVSKGATIRTDESGRPREGGAAARREEGSTREGRAFPHCGRHSRGRLGPRSIGSPIFSHSRSLPALRAL